MASWVGASPGQNESAEKNHGSRCAKGNPCLRRLLNQAANAAAKTKGGLLNRIPPHASLAVVIACRATHATFTAGC